MSTKKITTAEELRIAILESRLEMAARKIMKCAETIGILNSYGKENMRPTSHFGALQDQVDELAREVYSLEEFLGVEV
jgi:hypothetical protein